MKIGNLLASQPKLVKPGKVSEESFLDEAFIHTIYNMGYTRIPNIGWNYV